MISQLMRPTLVEKVLFSYNRNHAPSPPYSYTRVQTYVQAYMKWKKDLYFDSIDSIHKSLELKPIIAVKNFFISTSSSPHDKYSIPISAVSKKGSEFDISIKVIRFLRNYPSFFEEFKGPCYNLPLFRLTDKAIELDKEERLVYEGYRDDIVGRLKKFILMSGSRQMLPLKVIKGLRWYLGLPDDFFRDPMEYIGSDGDFRIVDIEDGLKGLAVLDEYGDRRRDKILSMMQQSAMRKGIYSGGADETIAFPLFPSKGLRLKQKIKDWSDEFQRLPYVSPYADYSHLNPNSDTSEKRVVGVLHELLCLFVEHAAETILKEAYRDEKAIDPHPLAKVRRSYIALMMESAAIMRNKRANNSKASDRESLSSNDSSCVDGGRCSPTEARPFEIQGVKT
ncbi:protein WHAT'S THIS FACTOR 9, mitochondrial isoform X2 [Salvia hispanica]|uniref:protein WHAT'S THIS FACTOR 9, mitochondrial isoform X2 n=1 Tax=Salvia hispanica TaxID=49212 RepID=UPI002009A938|nr:protein WHAT'S THIS FACTOR 9, mitochondrial isoform X2 [Salvia hispanica]